MTRVSLREAYDNKDVVAQIYAIRDTAESAEDSAEQAVTTANTASEHVDALVPQVEGAVENANSASASAQASAQTIAGYENRLATVESDLNAVTLRVTTAEGDIVTIQGRVTALETADGQNVKLTGEHAIGNYAVLLTGNQAPISGIKTFVNPIVRRTGIINPTPSFVESTCFTMSKTDDTVIGMMNVAGTPTTNISIVRTNSPTDASKYSKLFLRVSDTGKCDLVMESNTQQGYEQHTIYSFGN